MHIIQVQSSQSKIPCLTLKLSSHKWGVEWCCCLSALTDACLDDWLVGRTINHMVTPSCITLPGWQVEPKQHCSCCAIIHASLRHAALCTYQSATDHLCMHRLLARHKTSTPDLAQLPMRCVVVCIQAGEGKLQLLYTGSIDRLASFIFQATSLKTRALDCAQIMSACSIAQLQAENSHPQSVRYRQSAQICTTEQGHIRSLNTILPQNSYKASHADCQCSHMR